MEVVDGDGGDIEAVELVVELLLDLLLDRQLLYMMMMTMRLLIIHNIIIFIY